MRLTMSATIDATWLWALSDSPLHGRGDLGAAAGDPRTGTIGRGGVERCGAIIAILFDLWPQGSQETDQRQQRPYADPKAFFRRIEVLWRRFRRKIRHRPEDRTSAAVEELHRDEPRAPRGLQRKDRQGLPEQGVMPINDPDLRYHSINNRGILRCSGTPR
jgi:hypothetical protein